MVSVGLESGQTQRVTSLVRLMVERYYASKHSTTLVKRRQISTFSDRSFGYNIWLQKQRVKLEEVLGFLLSSLGTSNWYLNHSVSR
uniref:Uncharacterized protein n=1 Tax=Brassica oleracea var. oleracea TaxID=109376 RepID=A0A0D3BH87_BRAOL